MTTAQDSSILFPNGGWDTHHHVHDPKAFPYQANRHLVPPPATVQQYAEFKQRLGLTNSVLVHGMAYGDDCTSMKAPIPQLGSSCTRGTAIIDPQTTTDDDIRAMHAAGVRGIRVNLYRQGATEDLGLQKQALADHAARLHKLSLGWSITMTPLRTDCWTGLAPFVESELATAAGLGSSSIPIVTDHFALLKESSMLPRGADPDPRQQPGFAAVLGLMRTGRLWVKLSAPYRVSELAPAFPDVEVLVRALVDANPRRVVWGSDWPHTPRMRVRARNEALREKPYLQVDELSWLRSLRAWLSEREWQLVMVENPKLLFG